MKINKRNAVVTAVLCLLVFVAFAVVAQTNTNTPPSTVGGTTTVTLAPLWNAAIVVVVPAIIAGIKKLWPAIPSVTWPVLAPLAGVAINWLAAKGHVLPQSGWAVGAALGAAGVGLREIVDQVTQLRAGSSPPSATVTASGTN